MKISDETLMRYADGELAPAERAAVEATLATDPGSAARVAALRAQRDQLARAFGGVLREPVPERLLTATRSTPAASTAVTALDEARARKSERARARWSLPHWSAMAASLIVGLLLGYLALRPGDPALIAASEGGFVAHGDLARALTERLSGEPADAVTVGFTYRARNGEICRAFSLSRATPVAGIACRSGDAWRIDTLAQGEAAADGGYRLAGSALPPLIVRAVEADIDGEPLDAAAEAGMRSRGWRK
jgi:hypothetical protein